MKAWSQIQEAQKWWSRKNFGVTDQFQGLLGMVEEAGELAEALTSTAYPYDNVRDAIADLAIFGLDYLNYKDWSVVNVLENAILLGHPVYEPYNLSNLLVNLGGMAHHELKFKQGIRGNEAEHQAQLFYHVGQIYLNLYHWSLYFARAPLLVLVNFVWEQVEKRDWTQNKLTGGQR